MKTILVIMSFLSSIFGAKAQQSDTIEILDVKTFKQAVQNKNIQLVDVRTAAEFKKGAITKAINIDYFDQKKFKQAFNSFNKSEPLYLYCRSGNRSNKAAHQLIALGFTKIYDLKGGYLAWNN